MKAKTFNLKYGLDSENEVKTLLVDAFMNDERSKSDISIVGSPSKFSKYDISLSNESITVYVELKTRRVNSDSYPTSFVNKCKIEWYDSVKDDNTNFFVLWRFNDEYLYVKVDDYNTSDLMIDRMFDEQVVLWNNKNLMSGFDNFVNDLKYVLL